MDDEIGDLLEDLLDEGGVEGESDEEIGARVRARLRGRRRVSASADTGAARNLDVPLSRAQALAAAASANMTATPTRACLVARLVLYSSAHDDVSVTGVTVAGRPQFIGAANAPCPAVRFYRDSIDSLPVSWDAVPATQDVVVTVKNEDTAVATNIMGTLVVETVS